MKIQARTRSVGALFCVCAVLMISCAKPATPGADTATFDPDGTAHDTRAVPVPVTVSPEAQKYLQGMADHPNKPQTLAERRASTDKWRESDSAEARKRFAVTTEEKYFAGVRTDIITPANMLEQNRTRVLINLHGGGFNSDSGSLIEGIPIASLAQTKVVSVYYRLAPENPFPAAVDDAVAVYKELLKEYKPASIGIFGTSAGGILTAEVTAKLKQSGIPLPGAVGLFTMLADYANPGESQSLFTLQGFPGPLVMRDAKHPPEDAYVGNTDRKDPVLSPIYSDLHGFPASLLVTSTRDLLLSNTTIFHRALLQAGNDSQLVVFEALPHAFWYHFDLPETKECLGIMAKFFDQKVAR
jgi:epsilon-lactone hydrolase